MSLSKIQKWAQLRPWAVRTYAVLAVLILPFVVLYQGGQMLYGEMRSELPEFFSEVIAAIRTGRFK